MAASYGAISEADARMGDYYFSRNTLSEVSPAELSMRQLYAYAKLFSRPRRIRRLLADYPLDYRQLLWQIYRFCAFFGYYKPAAIIEGLFRRR